MTSENRYSYNINTPSPQIRRTKDTNRYLQNISNNRRLRKTQNNNSAPSLVPNETHHYHNDHNDKESSTRITSRILKKCSLIKKRARRKLFLFIPLFAILAILIMINSFYTTNNELLEKNNSITMTQRDFAYQGITSIDNNGVNGVKDRASQDAQYEKNNQRYDVPNNIQNLPNNVQYYDPRLNHEESSTNKKEAQQLQNNSQNDQLQLLEQKIHLLQEELKGHAQLESESFTGLRIHPGKPNNPVKQQVNGNHHLLTNNINPIKTAPHQISGLDCTFYGGPRSNTPAEITYWADIPSDTKFLSPFYHDRRNDVISRNIRNTNRDSRSKYITFELDSFGWESQRMTFETMIALSVAMGGRTLVLPPKQKFLDSYGTLHDHLMSFDDIYHLDSLNNEYVGINIITMEEFLLREGINGKLFNLKQSEILLPPGGQTNFDGQPLDPLWDYLRTVGYSPNGWDPSECIAVFPDYKDPKENKALIDMLDDILNNPSRPLPSPLQYQGRPVSFSAPPIERLREMMAGRKRLCLYTDEMQSATLIHFPQFYNPKQFTHFYSYLFFEDWRHDLWMKRFIRDHIRYSDEVMCASARVIDAIRKYSYSQGHNRGLYHSFDFRRANLQYQLSRMSVEEVVESLHAILPSKVTLFIVSDEEDNAFFQKLKDNFDICFLHDFEHVLEGVNPNFHGLIEQIVAARGEYFVGTYMSLFSSYVMRIRGYYSVKERWVGNKEGKLGKTFYVSDTYRDEMTISKAVQQPFFAREFPSAWATIDAGIGTSS